MSSQTNLPPSLTSTWRYFLVNLTLLYRALTSHVIVWNTHLREKTTEHTAWWVENIRCNFQCELFTPGMCCNDFQHIDLIIRFDSLREKLYAISLHFKLLIYKKTLFLTSGQYLNSFFFLLKQALLVWEKKTVAWWVENIICKLLTPGMRCNDFQLTCSFALIVWGRNYMRFHYISYFKFTRKHSSGQYLNSFFFI